MALSKTAETVLYDCQPLFGKWRLQEIIGEGSGGTVYTVTDGDGNVCALKVIAVSGEDETWGVLSPSPTHGEQVETYLDEITADIMNEVSIMHCLRGKRGIVGCQEYEVIACSVDGTPFRLILIRMELLTPLSRIMRQEEQPFDCTQAARIGADLCAALAECHRQGIIHRDIKPANVFVSDEGTYQLGDFGSAKHTERTLAASRHGTLAYIAPEIAAGQPYDATADLYSLGIMMYQLLHHRRLPLLEADFRFSDIASAVEKRLSGAPLPPPAEADEALGSIILQMCAFSPRERFASAEECEAALEEYLFQRRPRRKNLLHTKRAKIITFAVIVMLVLFAGSLSAVFVLPKLIPAPTAAILSCNVNGDGTVADDGEWMYLGGSSGVRKSSDGTAEESLCDLPMYDINLTDKWIVFSSPPSDDGQTHGLYRMNKDGSGLLLLDSRTVYNPVAYGRYVYYIAEDSEWHLLCRIPLSGGETETLGTYDGNTLHFYPNGGYLYLYDFGHSRLLRTDLKGGHPVTLLEQSLLSFCVDSGKLCFAKASYNETNRIFVCDIQNLSREGIDLNAETVTAIELPFKLFSFSMADGVIYACAASIGNAPEHKGVWRVDCDGQGLVRLFKSGFSVQTAGDRIYYQSGTTLYSADLRGNDVRTVKTNFLDKYGRIR